MSVCSPLTLRVRHDFQPPVACGMEVGRHYPGCQFSSNLLTVAHSSSCTLSGHAIAPKNNQLLSGMIIRLGYKVTLPRLLLFRYRSQDSLAMDEYCTRDPQCSRQRHGIEVTVCVVILNPAVSKSLGSCYLRSCCGIRISKPRVVC